MDILFDLLRFAGSTLIIVVGIIAVMIVLFILIARANIRPELEITAINKSWKEAKNFLQAQILGKAELKRFLKSEKKEEKKSSKENEKHPQGRLFVIEFEGDIKASQVESLRREITAVLLVAEKGDEVLLKVESPGGVVHGYGLAASQIDRLKQKGLKVTISVDKVAASGGYMMACLGHEIIAAPFAILGSIGVLAQIPNIHKLLKKNDVDFLEVTAGEYKRTVSLLGEITDKGINKLNEQINETHDLFKNFVSEHRPQLDISAVATGEYWYGKQALEKKLIDRIQTSDDYILHAIDEKKVFRIRYKKKKSIQEKLAESANLVVRMTSRQLVKFWQEISFAKG